MKNAEFKDTQSGFHFFGRLKVNPQTRVGSSRESQGFLTKIECADFCDKNLSDYIIYYIAFTGEQVKIYDSTEF